mgnify:CR=1 FL=1
MNTRQVIGSVGLIIIFFTYVYAEFFPHVVDNTSIGSPISIVILFYAWLFGTISTKILMISNRYWKYFNLSCFIIFPLFIFCTLHIQKAPKIIDESILDNTIYIVFIYSTCLIDGFDFQYNEYFKNQNKGIAQGS